MRALALAVELVERVQIGLGRGHHDVGVGSLSVHHAPILRQPHGHLALRIGAAGDVADRIEQQVRAAVNHRLQRSEGRVDRA